MAEDGLIEWLLLWRFLNVFSLRLNLMANNFTDLDLLCLLPEGHHTGLTGDLLMLHCGIYQINHLFVIKCRHSPGLLLLDMLLLGILPFLPNILEFLLEVIDFLLVLRLIDLESPQKLNCGDRLGFDVDDFVGLFGFVFDGLLGLRLGLDRQLVFELLATQLRLF
jgi:hypothetical protein